LGVKIGPYFHTARQMQQLAPLGWAQEMKNVNLRCLVSHFGSFVLPDHRSYHCLCLCVTRLTLFDFFVDLFVGFFVDAAIPTNLLKLIIHAEQFCRLRVMRIEIRQKQFSSHKKIFPVTIVVKRDVLVRRHSTYQIYFSKFQSWDQT
jgi:hypothetical protein